MKYSAFTLVVLAALILSACGGSGPAPKNLDGIWFARLMNSDSSMNVMFVFTLAEGSGTSLNISNFTVSSPSPCFGVDTSQIATFTVTGKANGFQTGSYTMTVSTTSGTGNENVATMGGTRGSDGTINGTWTITGFAGCTSATGPLVMSPPPPV